MTILSFPPPPVLRYDQIAAALRLINNTPLCYDETDFASWVEQARLHKRASKRIADHLLRDLKHDNTLPWHFKSMGEFRSYLRSQHACLAALRLAPHIWKRYRRWKAVQS